MQQEFTSQTISSVTYQPIAVADDFDLDIRLGEAVPSQAGDRPPKSFSYQPFCTWYCPW